MKKDILIFATLTIATILIFVLSAGQNVIDIQLHDTYIVLDNIALAIIIIGPLTFLLFLSLGLARKFKTTWTNIGFIIGLSLVSLIFFRVAQLQSRYRDEIQMSSAVPLPAADKERFLSEMNTKIILTWGLFGVCIVGIGWIGFRTYLITKPWTN